jgi:hypothetical protein
MNKLAERIVPAMNDAELEALIDDHYAGEAQTLTSDAEANLLKLTELREHGPLHPQQLPEHGEDLLQLRGRIGVRKLVGTGSAGHRRRRSSIGSSASVIGSTGLVSAR